MAIIIKNVDTVSHTYNGQTIAASGQYTVQAVEQTKFSVDDNLLADIASAKARINDGIADISGTSAQIDFLKGNQVHDVNVKTLAEPQPFALPTYRTKRSKTTAWTTCAANSTTDVDYDLTDELYVSGGKIVYKDAKEGDYITACVYDKDSVLPEAYRAALCESWPVVAEYIVGEWLKPASGYDTLEINTYPLNAKITANLYLRISYHASSEAGDRKVAVNYYLTKKL